MKNKGFTLMELLAVIVILSILTLLTTLSITKLVKDSKDDLEKTQIGLIKSAAEVWAMDNLNKISSDNSCSFITLQDLYDYGNLDKEVISPNNGKKYSDDLKIKITRINTNNNPIIDIEVNPSSVDECTKQS